MKHYESGDLMRPTKSGANIGTITAIKFDQTGGLWAGTDERGAFYYPEAGQSSAALSRRVERFTFESTAGGMRSNHIYSIFIDREGIVWFGTNSGVCRYDPQGPLIEALSGNPESGFARALFQSSDGSLWCGTNSGLFVRDEKEAAWFPVKELAGKTVHSLAEDSTGRLLVGTAGGLYASALPPDGRKVRQRFARIDAERVDAVSGDSIRAICRFQGAIYIASFGRGVERLDGSRRVLIWPLESGYERQRQMVSLHSDKDERLWISAGEAGVFVFDGKQVTSAPSSLDLDGDAAWAIEGESDGGLWFGTSRGLYLFRSGELRAILEGVYVRGLAASASGERASLWCATVGGGLFQVLVDERGEVIIAQINAEQGLPSESAFATLSTRSAPGGETVWIGTSRGVVRYEPGRIAPSLRATRIMGKRMYQPDEMRAGLNLEYPQDSLALDVAAIGSRTFPDQFQYSFSLFDGAGQLVMRKLGRDSQLIMENLSPGRYRVEALAYSKDLIASAPLAFKFTVAGAPFPWTSAALSILLALALAAVGWGWRQNRRLAGTNYALGAANRQLGETRMQLANETETERRRISRDLHDQTLADLRRLLLLTDSLPPGQRGNGQASFTPAEFRGEIESIATEIRRICEDLSPSALANVGLTAALEWALSDAVTHLPPDKRFDYEFACEENLEERLKLAPGVRIQIYRIAQEAISNTCRHAGATRVRLSVAIEPAGDFVLRLEDDGPGFEVMKSATMSGRGLTNIRSRASLIEAEVAWHERPGGGTIFALRKLPSATGEKSGKAS